VFADGVSIRPEAAREGFIDDRDARRPFIVLLGEVATRKQARTQRLKILRAD